MKKEQTPHTYNEMFKQGGYQGSYDLPYQHSPYFPMYKQVLKFLKKYNKHKILEVGCGTGAFAKFLLEKSHFDYRGFDFSPVAIEKCRILTKREELFSLGDATKLEPYSQAYQAIVCTEVLEHIPNDIECISQWKKDRLCICSVPNYDSEYHARYFKTVDEIYDRYNEFLDIHEMIKVKKPILSNLSLSSYFQYIRWNRYRFKRLMALIGFDDFEHQGGWFIFVATKK